MGKAKKQKESGNEKFLKNVGQVQLNASSMFDPAHQSVLNEARTDQTDLFRGRLAGDTWQQLGTNLGGNNVTGGDTRRQGRYEGIATDAINTSLREGTRRGAELRDERINLGASSRLSNARQSNASIQQAARNSFAESAQKAQAANDMNQMLTGAAFTLASAGIGEMGNQYQAGKAMGSKPETFDPSGLGAAGGESKNWLYKKGYSSGYNKWLNSMPEG
jgi:hypothetical protein